MIDTSEAPPVIRLLKWRHDERGEVMSVDEYLAGIPEPQRSTLTQMRAILRRLLPGADETISYGMPAFKIDGKAVAGYASFKGHCSYFPHSGSVLSELTDELEGYEWSKGTLKFAVDQPLPEELLTRLIEVRMSQLGMS